MINTISDRHHLDPDFISSVIHAESGFNPRAVSPKGAQGLMQLMPGTASKLGVSNAFDPSANVEGGTRYLSELLERYNFDVIKALAAYNAGPQRVQQYGGVPPYYETRAYVARIVRDYNRKKIAERKAAAAAAKTTAAEDLATSARCKAGRAFPTQRSQHPARAFARTITGLRELGTPPDGMTALTRTPCVIYLGAVALGHLPGSAPCSAPRQRFGSFP